MIVYIGAMILVIIGVYTILNKDNIIKKVMGLSIFTNGIHLLLISIGFRYNYIAPIMTKFYLNFSNFAVDPIPQALVLTSIVINISVTAFALFLTVRVYEIYSTLNFSKIRRLRG